MITQPAIASTPFVYPYLDMDGVLVNYTKGCQKVMGDQFEKGRLPPAKFQEYRARLYQAIERTPDFWYDLEPLPGHHQLYERLLEWGYLPTILTAVPAHWVPHEGPGLAVAQAKQAWIEREFGKEAARRFIATSGHQKQEFIKPGALNILIDDLGSNIARWNQAGGVGILHHDYADSLYRFRFLIRP